MRSATDSSAAGALDAPAPVRAAVARAFADVGTLPVLEASIQQVLRLVDDPDSPTSAVTDAIDRDPELAARVLQLANSAHAGRHGRSTTVRQAVTTIGRRSVRQLAVGAATYRFFERAPGNGRGSRGQLHVHAVATAAAATEIAARAGLPTDVVHLAALLHDLGKLVMPLAFGEAELDEVAREHPHGRLRAELERARFGIDHAQAGGLFAAACGIDPEVAGAIAGHHGTPGTPSHVAACVQVAAVVTAMVDGAESDDALLHAALDRLGLGLDVLDHAALAVAPLAGGAAASDLARQVARLERLARTDDLTGLASRGEWFDRVHAALDERGAGSVLLCDLDAFKAVNDGFGHAVGDQVLVEAARCLPRHGLAGRIGGDEFAVWCAGTPGEAAVAARRLAAEVSAAIRERWPDLPPVGLSIGLATAPEHGTEVHALLAVADERLYEVKRARGRAGAAPRDLSRR